MGTLNNKCFTGCTTNNPDATSSTLQQEVSTIINTSLRKYIDNLPAFVAVEVPKVKLNFTEGEITTASEVANPMFNWALQMCLTAVAEDTELSFNEVLSALREQLFSRVCEAGTLAWIKRYPVVTQLGLNGLIESYKHMPKSYFEGMLGMSDGKNAYDDKLIAFLNEYSKLVI